METGPRQLERKVVTALFCDVVGSTELGERLDPEDIERLMGLYFRLARREIETHGGSVEKFIGDAVVGVFGAPVVHEDDPARAIRAALGIVAELAASNLELQVRLGIHSGLAVVRVGDDRSAEESRATGDILNTAARLQNAAGPGGIAVGEPTYLRARDEFDWEDLGEVPLKGKALPVHVWQPLRARTEATSPAAEATQFVGRDEDLARLVKAFERSSRDRRLELVTIVAEAGMGKSRLVRELARRIQPTGARWLRGRCLPYGDGISFWALGEIVKAAAGITDGDDQATIRQKLDAAISEPDPELHAWQRDRLGALVGLQTDDVPQQEAVFAAWTRFLVSVAAEAPLVLVVEDVHWADPALLSFLTYLADHATNAPIFLVVTARTEVSERHPEWLAQAGNATVVQLVSLGDDAIRQLVEAALTGATPELVATVLERAAGSPLYAEQLAALIAQRRLSDAGEAVDEAAIPATIQALLAARIDALPKELKPALLDASVIGRTFWSGAVASLQEAEPGTVAETLEHLARRELTRPNVPSTLEGEVEYGFWHALLRDVAYSFLPRGARLAKHRAAAAWITTRAVGAGGEVAEIVADHLRRALELATASGAVEEEDAIRADLATALLAAGDHTLGLEPSRAVTHFRAALELLSPADGRRPAAYVQLGKALMAGAQYVVAADAYGQAVEALRGLGDELAAAELAVERAMVLWNAGQREIADAEIEAVRPILEANPGPGLVGLHVLDAVDGARGARVDVTDAAANRAIELAAQLGLPTPYRAVAEQGLARVDMGDLDGTRYVREAVASAIAAGNPRYAAVCLTNMAGSLSKTADALATFDEALELASRYGISDSSIRGLRFDTLELAGRWDEVVAEAPALLAGARQRGDAFATFMIRMTEAGVRVQRGEAVQDIDDLPEKAASIGLRRHIPISVLSQAALLRGDRAAARQATLDALAAVPEGEYITGLVHHVSVALQLGDLELARLALAKRRPALSEGGSAALSELAIGLVLEAEGDVEGAIARFERSLEYMREHGWLESIGQSLAGIGRCRIALGEVQSGLQALGEAREIAASLKAAPQVARIDASIAAAAERAPAIDRAATGDAATA